MLTEGITQLVSPPVIVDQDLDQAAASLYRLLKTLLDSLTITEGDVGVVLAGGARNLYAGHAIVPSGVGAGSVVVTIGITMANADYNVYVTAGDGLSENRLSYSDRTTTQFTVRRSAGNVDDMDVSWLVAF